MTYLAAIFTLALALVGPLAIAHFGRVREEETESLFAKLFCQFFLAVLGVGSLWMMLHPLGFHPHTIGLIAPSSATFAWGSGIAAFFVLVAGPFLLRLPHWLGLQGFENTLSSLALLPPWYLVIAVVIGGTIEEILYRGVALAILTSLGLDPLLAGLLVVAAFAIAHVPTWGVGPALTTAISGAILTAFFLWHGDLLANIIAHVATDFVGIALAPCLAWLRAQK
ncbi:MAG: CPBP family intramembrane glutamic endopeptidase [Pseudomonadota bacterium]